jgi:hypothetical protein
MLGKEMYLGSIFPVPLALFAVKRFPSVDCRIMFAGIENWRMEKTCKKSNKRKSRAWWNGWKEGYKLGVRDGAQRVRKTISDRSGQRH